jgi:hypothetical protein
MRAVRKIGEINEKNKVMDVDEKGHSWGEETSTIWRIGNKLVTLQTIAFMRAYII